METPLVATAGPILVQSAEPRHNELKNECGFGNGCGGHPPESLAARGHKEGRLREWLFSSGGET